MLATGRLVSESFPVCAARASRRHHLLSQRHPTDGDCHWLSALLVQCPSPAWVEHWPEMPTDRDRAPASHRQKYCHLVLGPASAKAKQSNCRNHPWASCLGLETAGRKIPASAA